MLTRFSDVDRTFAMLDELRRRMDHYFADEPPWRTEGDTPRSNWPAVRIRDAGASLVLSAELPGVSENDLVLTLTGARRADAPEGYSVHRQERASLRFSRSFTLPCKVDPERSSASLKDGVLTVTVPKAPDAQPRQIAVRAQ